MKSNPAGSRVLAPMARGAWVLALALAAGSMAWAQQDQPPPSQGSQPQQGQDQGQSQDQPPQSAQQPPAQGQQPRDQQRKVISRDTLPGTQNGGYGPNRGWHEGESQNGRAAAGKPVPDSLTLPSGTILRVRTNEYLSSDDSKAGQSFTATLQEPLVVNGWVVARRGETIQGTVVSSKKAGRVKGVSQLELQLTDVTLVDGQVVPIQTALWQGSGGTSHGRDAATIATTTGLGAAIGAAANYGTGAAVGAGAGLLTGIGAVLLTRGRPTIVPPESPLDFQITSPVTINTAESKQAYFPVRPGDYEARRGRPYPVGYPVPPPPPYPYYCGYYRPCFAPPYGYYRGY
jgi:hypothetical protein